MIICIPPSFPQFSPGSDWAESGLEIPRLCPVCSRESIIGHGRRRKQAHDEEHDWIGIRRGLCNLCKKTFTFLPLFSPPYTHYSPYRPGRRASALLCGGPLVGSCRPGGSRSEPRAGPFHAAPRVSMPGYLPAAFFILAATTARSPMSLPKSSLDFCHRLCIRSLQ